MRPGDMNEAADIQMQMLVESQEREIIQGWTDGHALTGGCIPFTNMVTTQSMNRSSHSTAAAQLAFCVLCPRVS
jgi:hypothetical protein